MPSGHRSVSAPPSKVVTDEHQVQLERIAQHYPIQCQLGNGASAGKHDVTQIDPLPGITITGMAVQGFTLLTR